MNIEFKSSTGINPSRLTPTEKRAVTLLDKMELGTVIDTPGLAEKIGVAYRSMAGLGVRGVLTKYSHVVTGRRWFGNVQTIAEVKKQFK